MVVEEKLGKKASEIRLVTPSTPSTWFGWSVFIITWDQTERQRERERAKEGLQWVFVFVLLRLP